MTPTQSALCPDAELANLIAKTSAVSSADIVDVEDLLGVYPDDPRLHFLLGSLRAGDRDFQGAQTAMRRAVDLAPDYAIARFQLGFLLLTSGAPAEAEAVWERLGGLADSDPLQSFVAGLRKLIRDDFEGATRMLAKGIALNNDNEPLNRDMRLLISEMERSGAPNTDKPSAAHQLLQQSALKATRH